MHPMRALMLLSEAPRKPAGPTRSQLAISHADRARQEQERQAQAIVQMKTEAATLKAQVQKVIEEIPSYEFGNWQHDWTGEVRAEIKKIYAAQLANAEDELAYAREDNPDAKLAPISFLDCLTEGFAQWWDEKKYNLDWSDGTYRQNEYMNAHPRTEMSDDLSRLQSEVEMLSRIRYRQGGFGSAGEMTHTLTFISNHLDSLARYSDGGWSGVGETARSLVTSGLPLILLYCSSIAALK